MRRINFLGDYTEVYWVVRKWRNTFMVCGFSSVSNLFLVSSLLYTYVICRNYSELMSSI